LTLVDEPFWAFATQQPSRIAAKPNALNRDKIRFLILTCFFYLRRPAPAVAQQLRGNLHQFIQIPRQLAWKPLAETECTSAIREQKVSKPKEI
jgi:hypothetical protein